VVDLIKKNYLDVAEKKVNLGGSSGVSVRWLITNKDGAPRYAMRRFEIKIGGRIELHSHPEEHEIYILSGKGEIFDQSGSRTLASQGDALFVPPNEKHGYQNVGEESFIFLCVIPLAS
jgi:quercetin dioxygenase-like cupin family protein